MYKFSELTDEMLLDYAENNVTILTLKCDVCDNNYKLSLNSIRRLKSNSYNAFGCEKKAHRSATVTSTL